jgi:hypothetical protein
VVRAPLAGSRCRTFPSSRLPVNSQSSHEGIAEAIGPLSRHPPQPSRSFCELSLISASVFLRTRARRAECTERTMMGAAPASTSATSHIGTAEPTYGSCDLVRSRCGLGRHHERDDVLARFEARSILRRGMLRRKRTDAHAVPRATTRNFGFENVGLVTTRP